MWEQYIADKNVHFKIHNKIEAEKKECIQITTASFVLVYLNKFKV